MRVGKREFISKCQAMTAVFINVEIEGNIFFTERSGEHERVFHGHSFVAPGAPNETGWSIRFDLEFTGELFDEFA